MIESEENTKVVSLFKFPADKTEVNKLPEALEIASLYSEMKYGSQAAIRKFAEMIYSQYHTDFAYNRGDIFIASTLISDIESSSHLIAKELQTMINQQRFKGGLKSCKYIELLAKKKSLVSSDYGKVSNKKDRVKSQNNLKLIVYPQLNTEDLLIVCNDSFVTGAQWKLQNKLLRESGVKSYLNYYFIIEFEQVEHSFDVGIEDFFNNYKANTEREFIDLIAQLSISNQLRWNKRTILRLLSLEGSELERFTHSITTQELSLFYNYAILSDAHMVNDGIYMDRLNKIKSDLEAKGIELI